MTQTYQTMVTRRLLLVRDHEPPHHPEVANTVSQASTVPEPRPQINPHPTTLLNLYQDLGT